MCLIFSCETRAERSHVKYELLLFLYVIHVHVAYAIDLDLCYVEINILLFSMP